MTIRTEHLAPGTFAQCRRCRHWLERHWANGHPNPCELVHWEGPRHVQPEALRGPAGDRCSGFADGPGAAGPDPEPGGISREIAAGENPSGLAAGSRRPGSQALSREVEWG